MMTVNELYKNFVGQLKIIYDERESTNITDWVFESAGIKKLDRITEKRKQLNNSTVEQLNTKLLELLKHTPVQYVLGEAWFFKMKLFVNEHVLIPRPETEELVEWVVEDVRGKMYDVRSKKSLNIPHPTSHIVHILDIGTGSGCIAIALKKELPGAEIFAIDVSKDALDIAKKNASDQNAEINFLQIDFLNEDHWKSLQSFHIIISNPPYIPESEKTKLAKNVVEHEPHVALFVTNYDPFIFYREIASFASKHLKENGKVYVEVHEDYSKEVQKIFAEKKFKTEIKKDIYGRDRMICAYK